MCNRYYVYSQHVIRVALSPLVFRTYILVFEIPAVILDDNVRIGPEQVWSAGSGPEDAGGGIGHFDVLIEEGGLGPHTAQRAWKACKHA